MSRIARAYWFGLLFCLAVTLVASIAGGKVVPTIFGALCGTLVLVGLAWLAIRLFQRFLWRVGRRLAFSYFLIGVVPIPLLALLLVVLASVCAGFLSGHTYRNGVRRVHAELESAAWARLAVPGEASATPEASFAIYRDGHRVSGDPRAPAAWPAWLESKLPGAEAGPVRSPGVFVRRSLRWEHTEPQREELPPYVLLDNGDIVLCGAVQNGPVGVLALSAVDLEEALKLRSGVWLRLHRASLSKDGEGGVNISIGSQRVNFGGLGANGSKGGKDRQAASEGSNDSGPSEDSDSNGDQPANDAEEYFGVETAADSAVIVDSKAAKATGAETQEEGQRESASESDRARRSKPSLWFRMLRYPSISWGDYSAPLLHAATGERDDTPVVATIRTSPTAIRAMLFSGNAEFRTTIWAAITILAALLFDIYLVALLLAGFMIFGLSRAVNRMSRATEAVAGGDFSVRIPVRRKDQIGALQRTFNHMTEHLQGLVQTAVQKEALENELNVARQLQTSLLPHRLDLDPRVEIAAYFEPSAAIGGDYYDVLPLAGERLAIFVADVSGHGLPAGLRMAMIKAGVHLLTEQSHSVQELLGRLDSLVRSASERAPVAAAGKAAGRGREFVTASLSRLSLKTGDLDITNAGHPPLYVARATPDGSPEVDEIALPGSALGGIGTSYGTQKLTLHPGDTAIWLSDGLIEACNVHNEAFGYDRVRRTLASGTTAQQKIDALLAAVRAHTHGREVDDDRTVVALRWLGPGDAVPSSSS